MAMHGGDQLLDFGQFSNKTLGCDHHMCLVTVTAIYIEMPVALSIS